MRQALGGLVLRQFNLKQRTPMGVAGLDLRSILAPSLLVPKPSMYLGVTALAQMKFVSYAGAKRLRIILGMGLNNARSLTACDAL